MLHLYRWISLFILPFVALFLWQRQRKGKEHPTRLRERFGIATLPRPEGSLIWIHAASVGEANSVLPLIRRLRETHPTHSVLLTTGTVTSAQVLEGKLPEGTFHQFVPIDCWPAIALFLRRWKPDMAIWTESELWPNTVGLTARRHCAMVLLNARMSAKSFRSWQRFPQTAQQLLSYFHLILPQSELDETRFAQLGAPELQMLGNLKHDAPPLPADPDKLEALAEKIGTRHLWLASSTHPGEERMIAEAHAKLKADYPDMLTFIVPRHPERGPKIAAELGELGYRIALRSRDNAINRETDFYIADTIGELGIFYRLADIVFMGGSLVPHGGQNPLEPARLHCALLTGPHTGNFTAICAELDEKEALMRVHTVSELAMAVGLMFHNTALLKKQAEHAFALASEKQGVLERVLLALSPLLQQGDH